MLQSQIRFMYLHDSVYEGFHYERSLITTEEESITVSEISWYSACLAGEAAAYWANITETNKHVLRVWYVCVRKSCDDFCVFAPSFREDEDASHCAVPISTSLIKQIVNKAGNEDSAEHILGDFYGRKASAEPQWPYATKDANR